METVLPVPVRNVGNRTKTNGTARRVAHHPAHGIDNVAKGLSLCHMPPISRIERRGSRGRMAIQKRRFRARVLQ